MKNKINTGYGSVEFSEDKGFNISTDHEPLKSTDGLMLPLVTCKTTQMQNLTTVYKFLDEVLFEKIYVKLEEVNVSADGQTYVSAFTVNNNFFLHVILDVEGGLYPSLISISDNMEQDIIKFEYEGVQLNNFFSEIKKDIYSIKEK